MKLSIILFLATFYCSIFIFKETEAREHIEFKDLKNNATCNEELFTLDESYTNNTIHGRRRLRSGSALDCFGIGKTFSGALDWFLRRSANGTTALKVKFYGTTRNTPERVTLKHGDKFDLKNLDFDIKKRTVLIVHGFLSNGDEKWIEDMRKALLKWQDLNVFVVDWSDGSNTWNYYYAAVNTRTVGDQIATFFGQLIETSTQTNEINPESFGQLHFIGHSLGSHICGYAAQEMRKRQLKWKVQRITGLDPAQPCFKNSNDELRLDQNDAPFVDIIHTNGRVLSKLGLGLPYPVGHVDFYPNGGKVQPGCAISSSSLWSYLPLPLKKISETVCSHGRSYLFFIDSIMSSIRNGCTFWAHPWDLTYNKVDKIIESECQGRQCIEMGINSEKYNNNGTYFTVTGRSRPFCRVDNYAKKEVKDIIDQVKRKLDCESDAESKNETLVIYM